MIKLKNQTTRRSNLEDNHLYTRRRENLKFHLINQNPRTKQTDGFNVHNNKCILRRKYVIPRNCWQVFWGSNLILFYNVEQVKSYANTRSILEENYF
jgi:hypothetical protein